MNPIGVARPDENTRQVPGEYGVWALIFGDLVVFGDRDTVFGTLDAESETLPAEYRSHGSVYELDVPLFLFNAIGAPQPDYFHHNLDMARWLYT